MRHLTVNWALLLILSGVCASLYAMAPIRVTFSDFAMTVWLVLGACALLGYWQSTLGKYRSGICLTAVAQLATLAAIGAMASLPIAAMTQGYVDAALAHADMAIRLDWHAYLQFALDHPFYRNILKTGYFMFIPESFLLVIYMALTGHAVRVATYVSASILAICTALAGFCFAPAMGPFLYYSVPHEIVAYLNIGTYDTIRAIDLARSGDMTANFDILMGLISIPSMHTAGALLLLWLGWGDKWLRPLLLPLNLAMIAATPIDGSHYFIDIIGGGAATAIALGAVLWFTRRRKTAQNDEKLSSPLPELTPA